MDSFKIYLPSNASFDHFPSNTASNYQTHLNDPIQLDGDWEAGIESLFYSPYIGDEKETVALDLAVKAERKLFVNDVYPFHYTVTSDNKWLGYEGLLPEKAVTDPADVDGVLKCLNSINTQMTYQQSDVFHIYKTGKHFTIKCSTQGVTILLTALMSRYLGFPYRRSFSGTMPMTSFEERAIPKVFTKEDYRIKFVDSNVLQKVTRVIIKRSGRTFPLTNPTSFQEIENDEKKVPQVSIMEKSNENNYQSFSQSVKQLKLVWKNKVKEPHNIDIEFHKHGKLILHNYNNNFAVKLSTDMYKTFRICETFIGRGTEWAVHSFDHTKTYKNDFWFIDIYNDTLDYTVKREDYNISYEFLARKYDDVKYLIPNLSVLISSKLKPVLQSTFDSNAHKCEFSLHENHTKLELGKGLKLRMSKSLSFMLGFDENEFNSGNYISKRLPATLQQREQHLFILCDFIHSISYGNDKVNVLQEFIHESHDDKQIIEKRFQPISYNAVSKTAIDTIKIQLTNALFNPIHVRDSKTVAVIHFRRRRQ